MRCRGRARFVLAEAQRLLAGEAEWRDGAVLLASNVWGPNADAISRRLGLPRAYCRATGRRARKHKLWTGHRVERGDWFNKDGGVAFILDVCQLRGLVRTVAA